ncbi:hypothetical protein SAMN03097699_1270 [Flavobacteriaceae bacterium MAR_2010_188]|nr:hypothetical protein SAMN03097699_1270 [Flavobacteriaceae bacterium MAR_2010_188]
MLYNLSHKFFNLFLLSVCLFFSLAVSSQNQKNWHEYVDENAGYSLKIPAEPNYEDAYDTFTIFNFNEPETKRIYSFFAIDMRNNKDIDPEDAVLNFIENIAKNVRGKIVDKKKQKFNNGARYLAAININEKRDLKTQFTFTNGHLYYQSVEDFKDSKNASNIEEFFKSFSSSAPATKENSPWINYTNTAGAFSVKLPTEPSDISRVLPNPQDESGETYKINLYSSFDESKGDTYLFRYNDLPTGYFMENPDEVLSSVIDDLAGKVSVIGEPKTIFLDGHEGREIEIKLSDNYHSVARFFLRGNRTYFLLHQKIRPTDKVSMVDNGFFDSFKFNDYAKEDLFEFKPENANFKILFSHVSKTEIDSSDYELTEYKNTFDYYTTLKSSGDMYLLEYNTVADYFKIKSREDYYNQLKDDMMSWNDTIISQKTIQLDGTDALYFKIQNKETKVNTHHQIWLDNNSLFSLNAYIDQENEAFEKIFNSYKKLEKKSEIDYFSSKADLIRDNLKSNDSLVYKKALGSFSFYNFEESELPVLYDILDADYTDEKRNGETAVAVISKFEELNNSETVTKLNEKYTSSSSDEIKANVLSALTYLDDVEAKKIHIKLLFEDPPKKTYDLSWRILSPFTDSLSLATARYDDLLKLTAFRDYRANLLELSNRLYKEDKSEDILRGQETLLRFLDEDFKFYNTSKNDSLDTDFSSYNLLVSYLNYVKGLKIDSPKADEITKTIIDEDFEDWLQLLAITTRIESKLPSDIELVNQKMDSLYWRLEIMQALANANKFDAIPKKYLKSESFAELSLNNYLEYDDGAPNSITTLGTIKIDSETFYAISFSYESEEDEEKEYLSVVGPVKDLTAETEFRSFDIQTDWEEVNKDWKKQAEALLANRDN